MQTTWKTFETLQAARWHTKGVTRRSIDRAATGIFASENLSLIATSSIDYGGIWSDGSLVVTDQRLIVSYLDDTLRSYCAHSVWLMPSQGFHEHFLELNPQGPVRLFIIPGIAVQAIALTNIQCDVVAAVLSQTHTAAPARAEHAPAADDPVDSLATLKKLLDQGLVSQGEYEAKKKEILDRL